VLVSTSPDSGSVNAPDKGEAEFQFDEVVSERPSGAASLSTLVLISPRDGEPHVEWHRSRITVRPRNGWRDNTVYTITVMPGLSDLRNNTFRSPIVSVFSTGPSMPSTLVSGIVYDWVSGSPARGATVEAMTPDSTTYVAATDSSGTFALMHIPAGPYILRAYQDADHSREIGQREAWDSTSIALADTSIRDLYLFVHDSAGPRITTISVRDSLHLRVTFDKPISPRQALDSTLFSLVTTDSVPVRVVSARRASGAEGVPAESAAVNLPTSVVPVPPVRRDTAAAAPPVRPVLPAAAAAVPPRPKRQSPAIVVVLEVATPLPPETNYRLTATGILNLLGLPGTSSRGFATPRPAPRAPAAGDSAAVVPPDSIRPPPITPPPPLQPDSMKQRLSPAAHLFR
jgi:hypothetical protein